MVSGGGVVNASSAGNYIRNEYQWKLRECIKILI